MRTFKELGEAAVDAFQAHEHFKVTPDEYAMIKRVALDPEPTPMDKALIDAGRIGRIDGLPVVVTWDV